MALPGDGLPAPPSFDRASLAQLKRNWSAERRLAALPPSLPAPALPAVAPPPPPPPSATSNADLAAVLDFVLDDSWWMGVPMGFAEAAHGRESDGREVQAFGEDPFALHEPAAAAAGPSTARHVVPDVEMEQALQGSFSAAAADFLERWL